MVFDLDRNSKGKWNGDVSCSIQYSNKNKDTKEERKEMENFLEVFSTCLDLLENDGDFVDTVLHHKRKLESEDRSIPIVNISGVEQFPTKRLAGKVKDVEGKSATIINFSST